MSKNSCVFAVYTCGLFAIAGCGASAPETPTAPVKGLVTYNGQPVTEGTLYFIPHGTKASEAGKQAGAAIGPDGKFVATTYRPNDGVTIGKCDVTYTPPGPKEIVPVIYNPDGSHIPGKYEPSPYEKLVPDPDTIEIKKGNNELTIQLKPKP